ncbi:MAG: GAF domain-containing protein [Pseudomonadota bacterium]
MQLAMAQRDRTLRRTQSAVLAILRQELLSDRSLDEQLKAITRIGAEALGVSAVGIWHFDEARQVASCLERWDATANAYTKVPAAPLHLYADVRDELSQNFTLRAVDARAHPLVGPYMNRHYPDLGPVSIMIEGIRQSNRAIGHVSVISFGTTRDWTIEEQSFARSLADLVGVALLQDQLDQKRNRRCCAISACWSRSFATSCSARHRSTTSWIRSARRSAGRLASTAPPFGDSISRPASGAAYVSGTNVEQRHIAGVTVAQTAGFAVDPRR